MPREELLKLLPSSSLSCQDHPRQELDFYCQQCSVPVCVKCTIISHRDHPVTEANQQVGKTKEELSKGMDNVKKSEEKLTAVLKVGKETKEKIKGRKEEVDLLIRQSISSLHKLLEGREEALIEQSNKVAMAKQARLSRQLDSIKALMEDMTACEDLSLTATRDYSDVELLSIAHSLQKRATKLHEKFTNTPLQLCVTPSLNVEMNVSKIASSISSLGTVDGKDPDVCPEETTVEIPSVTYMVGKELQVKVISRDTSGKRLSKGGATVSGQITCTSARGGGGGKKPSSGSVTDSGDGTYIVSFVPQQYGPQKLSLFVNDIPIKQSPFDLYISRDYTTLKAPLCSISDMPSPYFIAIADDGDVFVTSNTHHCVYVFSASGQFKRTIGSKGKGQLQFLQPTGIAISGNVVYVAENNGNRIHRFTKKGEFIDMFGSEGSGKGQLKYPWGICVDSKGKLYVTEYDNDRVQVFNQDGSHSHFINGDKKGTDRFKKPESVAIDSANHLHITGHHSNNIAVFTLDGTFVKSYPIKCGPCGITFDPAGYALVSMNGGPSRIGVFDSAYNSILSTDKALFNLRGIAVAPDGLVWVAEVGQNRLLIF